MAKRSGSGRTPKARQLLFPKLFRAKGGGRKKSPDSGVSHAARERVTRHAPVHVTAKLAQGLPPMRTKACVAVIWNCFEKARERAGRKEDGEFRLIEYSIQDDHLHLIIEADGNDSLSRGMCGLKTRVAKALNRLWGRKGRVWKERFHMHVLRKPREMFHALKYVFTNGRKHGRRWNPGRPDPFSSALWFEGWRNYADDGWVAREGPIAKARSWLRRVGWRRLGLLTLET